MTPLICLPLSTDLRSAAICFAMLPLAPMLPSMYPMLLNASLCKAYVANVGFFPHLTNLCVGGDRGAAV